MAGGVAMFSLSGVMAIVVVFLVGALTGYACRRMLREDTPQIAVATDAELTVTATTQTENRDETELAPAQTEEADSIVDGDESVESEAAPMGSRDADSLAADALRDPVPAMTMPKQGKDENLPAQLRGAKRSQEGRFFRFNQPGVDQRCGHSALTLTATNAWSWSTRCPACGMQFTMWWLTLQEKATPKATLVGMARDMAVRHRE